MKKSVLCLEEKNTTLIYLLSNCPQIHMYLMYFMTDPSSIVLVI